MTLMKSIQTFNEISRGHTGYIAVYASPELYKIPQTVQKIVLALNTIYRILFLITKMFRSHFIRFYTQFDICFLFHDTVFYREQIDNVP